MENNHQLTHTEQPEDNPGKFDLNRWLEAGLTLILPGGLYLFFWHGHKIGYGYRLLGLGVLILIGALIGKYFTRKQRSPIYSDAWYDDPILQPRRQKYEKMVSRRMIFSLLMILFLGLSDIYDDWIQTLEVLLPPPATGPAYPRYGLPDSIKLLAVGTLILTFLSMASMIIALINNWKMADYMPVYKDAKRIFPGNSSPVNVNRGYSGCVDSLWNRVRPALLCVVKKQLLSE